RADLAPFTLRRQGLPADWRDELADRRLSREPRRAGRARLPTEARGDAGGLREAARASRALPLAAHRGAPRERLRRASDDGAWRARRAAPRPSPRGGARQAPPA